MTTPPTSEYVQYVARVEIREVLWGVARRSHDPETLVALDEAIEKLDAKIAAYAQKVGE